MAGRFPLYTDADINGPVVQALIDHGWDVLRAIDVFPEGTDGDFIEAFEELARQDDPLAVYPLVHLRPRR